MQLNKLNQNQKQRFFQKFDQLSILVSFLHTYLSQVCFKLEAVTSLGK